MHLETTSEGRKIKITSLQENRYIVQKISYLHNIKISNLNIKSDLRVLIEILSLF